VIVSGRTRASLSALFPDAEPWIIAEHGAWRRGWGSSFIEALEARRNSAADEVECPGHEAA